jgi:hypothetical protein
MVMTKSNRRRVKTSATVDPELLDGVDAYLRERPDCDRSKVIDEALMLWLAQEQDRAMEAQFDGTDLPDDELLQWNAVLDANARIMWRRGDE